MVIRTELRRLLARQGYDVTEAGSVPDALAAMAGATFDLVLADVRLPGAPGTDLVPRAGGVPVVMMTSYATVRDAVDAIKLGAVDYVSKPFDHDELLALLERTLSGRRAPSAPPRGSGRPPGPALASLVTESARMKQLADRISRVALSDVTVLVLGESGTGKELVARAIHEEGKRPGGPFVAVNCAAIPEPLIESELFGHEKGAFTGASAAHAGLIESAHGGTLFLDEIGELPRPAQARLLRVLQERDVRRVGATRSQHVDVRVLAATHRDLPQMVQDGSFRGDLFFRLRVFELVIPPLRERAEDVLVLAEQLLARACARIGRSPASLDAAAADLVRASAWPGNVRELENTLERALVLCDAAVIGRDMLLLDEGEAAPAATPSSDSLDEYFRRFVLEHEGQLSETELARRLGISRKTLWERRQRFGLARK